MYTQFTHDTHFPLNSYRARYGGQHTIRQLLTSLIKQEIIPVLHTELPMDRGQTFDPKIVPGYY